MQQQELGAFIKALKRSRLTAQQRRTLKGQAIAGDLKGAQKGFQRLTEANNKNGGKLNGHEHSIRGAG